MPTEGHSELSNSTASSTGKSGFNIPHQGYLSGSYRAIRFKNVRLGMSCFLLRTLLSAMSKVWRPSSSPV